jgi:hypothetical protein
MDCEGCGFTFETSRGDRGNFYFGAIETYVLVHECGYCGTVTKIDEGVIARPGNTKGKKDWRYADH